MCAGTQRNCLLMRMKILSTTVAPEWGGRAYLRAGANAAKKKYRYQFFLTVLLSDCQEVRKDISLARSLTPQWLTPEFHFSNWINNVLSLSDVKLERIYSLESGSQWEYILVSGSNWLTDPILSSLLELVDRRKYTIYLNRVSASHI